MILSKKKQVLLRFKPHENKNHNTLLYWRKINFNYVLISTFIFGVVVLIPSIVSCITDRMYFQIGFDLFVVSCSILFFINKKISYKTKTFIFLTLIYLLSISLMLSGGHYTSGGFAYLIAFSILASIWKGTKAAVITICINIFTLLMIGTLFYNQWITVSIYNSYKIIDWITISVNILVINAISSIAVGIMLDGLEQTNSRILRLKNQLTKKQIKLIEAKTKAEGADHLKTKFLANMTHELKTPLNAVVGFSKLIEEEKITDLKTIYAYQRIIAENGDMLMNLINDILDLSVIESGQMKIKKEPVFLHNLIQETRHTFDDQIVAAYHKDINFNIKEDWDYSNFQFITDPLRLKQVINNLIKNALKFTDEGEINFSFELVENNKLMRFNIQDTGIGISEINKQKLFKRFIKLNKASKNDIKGTGLGLAISKQIVELLGGEIGVESTLGIGSTFYFTISLN